MINVTNDNTKGSDGGTGHRGRNEINVNNNQVDNFIAGARQAGLDGRLVGYGVTFLHETLHTWTGTYAYLGKDQAETRTYPFDDVPKPGDANYNANTHNKAIGEVVNITNEFTRNLWGTREQYLMINNTWRMKDVNSKAKQLNTSTQMSQKEKANERKIANTNSNFTAPILGGYFTIKSKW